MLKFCHWKKYYPFPLAIRNTPQNIDSRLRLGSLWEPQSADPHAMWCGEGERKTPPYPIMRFQNYALSNSAIFDCWTERLVRWHTCFRINAFYFPLLCHSADARLKYTLSLTCANLLYQLFPFVDAFYYTRMNWIVCLVLPKTRVICPKNRFSTDFAFPGSRDKGYQQKYDANKFLHFYATTGAKQNPYY